MQRNWNSLRRAGYHIIMLLLLTALSGACHNQPDEKLERRYGAFLEILPANAEAKLAAGDFQEGARILNEVVAKSSDKKEQLAEIKEKENILFFTPEQISIYFGKYLKKRLVFYQRMENENVAGGKATGVDQTGK